MIDSNICDKPMFDESLYILSPYSKRALSFININEGASMYENY